MYDSAVRLTFGFCQKNAFQSTRRKMDRDKSKKWSIRIVYRIWQDQTLRISSSFNTQKKSWLVRIDIQTFNDDER